VTTLSSMVPSSVPGMRSKMNLYDIDNDQLTGAAFPGMLGLDWQFTGIGNFSGTRTSASRQHFLTTPRHI
jgi:hypothetical protein